MHYTLFLTDGQWKNMGVYQPISEAEMTLNWDDISVKIDYCKPQNGQSRGMAIRLGEKWFIVLGCNSMISFLTPNGKPIAMSYAERGRFGKSETFIPERQNTIIGRGQSKHNIIMREGSVYLVDLDTSAEATENCTKIMNMIEL